MPERASSVVALFGSLAEGHPEAFEIGAKKANVGAHDAEVRNLSPLDPEEDGLWANSEKLGGAGNVPRKVITTLG